MQTNIKPTDLRLLTFLAVFSSCCMLIAMIFAYKVIQTGTWSIHIPWTDGLMAIGPFHFPGGFIVFPMSYVLSDIVAELYGPKMARHFVWLLVFCMIFFSIIAFCILHLPSPAHLDLNKAKMLPAYQALFGKSLRLCVGFVCGLFISLLINIYIINKWRILVKGKYFWLRSVGSSTIGEGMFSVVCGFIIYTGVLSFGHYLILTLDIWLFKLIYTAIAAYPARILVNLMKQKGYGVQYQHVPSLSIPQT